MKRLGYALILFFLLPIREGHSLVPLESLLLGDMSQYALDRQSDPLEYIFTTPGDGEEVLKYKGFLRKYFGFYKEGENLENKCEFASKPQYARDWDRTQAIRATMASLQYTGLDLTSRAIAGYARYFEFTDEQWENLVGRLSANYCSRNLSVVSIKELKKSLNLYFAQNQVNNLPGITNNPFFPKDLESVNPEESRKENEFLLTVKLFRRFCSWGGEVDDPRLLTALLRDKYTMAFIIRRMEGFKLAFEPNGEKVYKEKVEPVRVVCRNLICRRRSEAQFREYFPFAIGSVGVEHDIERLWCHHFRHLSGFQHSDSPTVKKWQDQESLDNNVFELGQFTALVTGVPEFMSHMEKFDKGDRLFRYSLDRAWDNWADGQIKKYNKDLYYEEGLAMELVDRNLYFNKRRPEFKVVFDINLGEYDKTVSMLGKIKGGFNLKFSQRFLKWIRFEWLYNDPRRPNKREVILGIMKKHIEDHVNNVKNGYTIPPWKGDLTTIIAEEILEQIAAYEGSYFKERKNEDLVIPVTLGYGPFALRYIHYENNIKSGKRAIDYSTYEYND